MAVERELKFHVADRSALVARLMDLEAERVSSAQFEDNWVYDRDGELRAGQRLLRIRIDGEEDGALLTYKGPPTFEGALKVRAELESRVSDHQAVRELLAQLGFHVSTRYQKRREAWRLGGIMVTIDHTPIGTFCEFEGDGAEKLAPRCGFELDEAEPRTYLDLYEAYRQQHPEAPEEMVFPEAAEVTS